MCGSRNFCRLGSGPSDIYKNTDMFFLVLNLFYRSPMITFKENYHFLEVPGGGPTFSRGGGGGGGGSNCLSLIETHIT